jgi:hypothetical protein
MLSILETGSNHKANIFKEFHAPHDWKNAIDNIKIIRVGNPFSEIAVLNKNFELLAFYQIMGNDFSFIENEILKTDYHSTISFVTPKRIEAFPFHFHTPSPNNEPISEIEFKWEEQHFILRNYLTESTQQSSKTYSSMDLVLSLTPKNIFSKEYSNAFHVHKTEEGFHLILTQDDKLQFANSFEMGTAEEVLYFTISIAKEFGIKQEDICLYYNEDEFEKSAIEIWESYIGQVVAYQNILPYPKVKGEIAFDLRAYIFLFQAILCE